MHSQANTFFSGTSEPRPCTAGVKSLFDRVISLRIHVFESVVRLSF